MIDPNTITIVAAFANDEHNPLTGLKKEINALNDELNDLEYGYDFKLRIIHDATNYKICEDFRTFKNQIRIFHFGGHADGEQLQLDGDGAHGTGLAELLQTAPHLKLVFLNGCYTKGHVQRLLELGIKVVIATHAPIGDDHAVNFAKGFYQSLRKKHTIREAFNSAKAGLNLYSNGGDKKMEINIQTRGIKFREPARTTGWGMYLFEENADCLEWKIPLSRLIQNELVPEKETKKAHLKNFKSADKKIHDELKNRVKNQNLFIDLKLTNLLFPDESCSGGQLLEILLEHDDLLITGKAGSGKTTVALKVLSQYINRAKQAEINNPPIPIRFNLAVWSPRYKNIEEWLTKQMTLSVNGFTKTIARRLIKEQLILPFFDGLDQVPESNRLACIRAISAFKGENPNIRIILACRHKVYKALKGEFSFRSIFKVDRLDEQQIFNFADSQESTDTNSVLLRQRLSAFFKTEKLRTPLMLKIATDIYQQEDFKNIQNESKSGVFEIYIDSQIEKKAREGIEYKLGSKNQILAWMSWLARIAGKEKTDGGKIDSFSADTLQPSWLPEGSPKWVWVYVLSSRVIQTYILFLCLSIKMIAIFPYEFIFLGLASGLMVGLVDGMRFTKLKEYYKENIVKNSHILVIIIANLVILPFLFGLTRDAPNIEIKAKYFALNGIIIGLLIALTLGCVFGVRGIVQRLDSDTIPKQTLDFNIKAAVYGGVIHSLVFSVIVTAIVILIHFFGSRPAQRWMRTASEEYFGSITRLFHFQNELFNSILLAIIIGIIFGTVTGPVMRGQRGQRGQPSSDTKSVNQDQEEEEEEDLPSKSYGIAILNAFGMYFIGYSAFFYVLIHIVNINNGVSVNEILIQSFLNGLTFASIMMVWKGAFDFIQISILKFLLYHLGYIPSMKYNRFLDYATKCGFLVKTNNEYRFYHDEIRDHFKTYLDREKVSRQIISKWSQARNLLFILFIAFPVLVVSYPRLREFYYKQIIPVLNQIDDYDQYTIRVGENIERKTGLVSDTIFVSTGDTIQLKARGYIHPGDFLTWYPPQGSSLGMFGFPMYEQYHIKDLEPGTLFSALVWQVSGDSTWQAYRPFEKKRISKDGYLVFNINAEHYQKLKGYFPVGVYIRRAMR